MKEVIIEIEGSQNFQTQDDIINLVLTGTLEKKENKYIIFYKESEVTGLMNTMTQIIIGTNEVTLNRIGDNSSCLVFSEGKKNVSYYETTEGAFTIGIYTNYLEVNVTDKRGEVSIDYTMEIDGEIVGDNIINLTYRVQKGTFWENEN